MKRCTSLSLSEETLEKLEQVRHAYGLRSLSAAVEKLACSNTKCSRCPVLHFIGAKPGTILYKTIIRKIGEQDAGRQ